MQMYNIQFRRLHSLTKSSASSFQKNIGYSFNQPFHLIGHVESIYSKRDIIAYIGTVQLFSSLIRYVIMSCASWIVCFMMDAS